MGRRWRKSADDCVVIAVVRVLVWGGLRVLLLRALALSLDPAFPYRGQVLAWTFGVVAFSLIVQGLTIKPLLRALRMGTATETEYDRAKVHQIALSSARGELEKLLGSHVVSPRLYARLRQELDSSLARAEARIARCIPRTGNGRGMRYEQRARLRAAEREAIQRAFHEGLISQRTAAEITDAADRRMDELEQELKQGKPNQQGPTTQLEELIDFKLVVDSAGSGLWRLGDESHV